MQGSTVKSGFQKANNLAFCRLNALSSAKGTGIKNATNVAFFRLSNPELREVYEGSQLSQKAHSKEWAFCFMASGGILLEQGIPMRQKCMEHFHSQHPCRSPTTAPLCKTAILPFCETALAGREAANLMDGMSN